MLPRTPNTDLMITTDTNIDFDYLKKVIYEGMEPDVDYTLLRDSEVIKFDDYQIKIVLDSDYYEINEYQNNVIFLGHDLILVVPFPISSISNLSLFVNFNQDTIVLECNYEF